MKLRKNEEKEAEILEDEIMSIVSEGRESGVLEPNEARMISNIFALDDKTAGDIATNRSKMVTLDINLKIKDVLNEMLNNSFSRYPVIEDDVDHIVGILHLKDAMKAYYNTPKVNFSLADRREILREVTFVSENMAIDDLFRDMQITKTQMVITVDEYGQTTGLVAMEDILEEIVGNIQDEYDADDKSIVRFGHRGFRINGLTQLERVEEALNISFGETNFDTINGYITDILGHIPTKEDNKPIRIEGYNFKIVDIEDKCIKSLLVTPAKVEGLPL